MEDPDWVIQREIPGFRGYLAQSDGTVLSLWTSQGKVDIRSASIRKTTTSHGYLRVRVRVARRKYVWRQLHTLIALAFHGEPAEVGHEVAHLDGDKENCRPENLQWMSHQENCSHKAEHGTKRVGEDHPSTKMSQADCYDVFRRRDSGEAIRSIARAYEVDPGTIRNILRCRTAAADAALLQYIIDIDDPMCGIGLVLTV